MFERYTEKARRTIFFARYEASQFGSSYIETEHLLLGVLREDKALANRFLHSHAAVEAIRKQVEGHATIREKAATSVDLPLSRASKRVLAYGAEEAKRLNHRRIGTEHLLLGLFCEEKSFAAQLLREQGLTLASVRWQVQQSVPPVTLQQAEPAVAHASLARLDQWLAERQARGGIWVVKQKRVANRTTNFAIYAGDRPEEEERLAQIQERIDFIVEGMERAIANHEFEQARSYSEEERKERENLRSLRERFHPEESPAPAPLLCIEIIRDERLSDLQIRCDDYIAEGVAQVWLLDPNFKRACTVTRTEGLREFKGEILQIANPPLEMDLKKIFD